MNEADPVRLCLDGKISPQVAVARMLLAGESPDGIARRVEEARTRCEAWTALARLVAASGQGFARLRRMLDDSKVDHAGAATPAQIAALFDRAVTVSPEASVAMFSLGDADVLAAATNEIVAWLDRHCLLAPQMDVLDLGCGIGRVAAALAGRVRSVLGVDVSSGMVGEAERRCAGMANVRFAVTPGEDLAALPDQAFDLLLAVDSFPYLVQADLGEQHVAEARRVLRAGGAFVILNFSYRGDPAADCADASVWAQRHGFQIKQSGIAGFSLWDAFAFVLIRKE